MKNGIGKIIIVLIFISLLSACQQKDEYIQTIDKEENTFMGMCGSTYEIAYEKPVQNPNILINQYGYATKDTKTALFRTENLPVYFYVIESDSKQVMFCGKIEETKYNEDTGEYISRGDFSDFTTKGSYYITASTIGNSYNFEINDDQYLTMYRRMADDLYNQILTETEKKYKTDSIVSTIKKLAYLLMHYELYSQKYQDGILTETDLNTIPDLLDIVKIYADWLMNLQTGAFSPDELASSAGFLADISQIYKKYDNSYARSCRNRADEFYEAITEQSEVDPGIMYYANTKNYILQGYAKYRTNVQTYLLDTYGTGDEDFILFGNLAYLTTTRTVSVEDCNKILSGIKDEAESTLQKTKSNLYNTASYRPTEILEQAMNLIIINYVLNSTEYKKVLRNQFDYLSGRNMITECYFDKLTDNVEAILLWNEMLYGG